jgi:hypothetical protein
MSQQEIMPEPQSNKEQPGNEDINSAQPYYWSTQPKEEPASGHDESLSQNDYASGYQSQNETVYSYPENSTGANATADFAQTQTQTQGQQQQQQFQSQQTRNPYAPDGDAFETGYNPYNSYNADNSWQSRQSTPPWVRPQRSRSGFRWLWLVLFVFLFMGPLLHFIGAALFFLFPLLFIGLIIFASVVFWSTVGTRRRGPGGSGGYNGWRGPWGW